MKLPAGQWGDVTIAHCTEHCIHEANMGPRIILGLPFPARRGSALLPSSKHVVYEECLHACVPHVSPLSSVQDICPRVQDPCRSETPLRVGAMVITPSSLLTLSCSHRASALSRSHHCPRLPVCISQGSKVNATMNWWNMRVWWRSHPSHEAAQEPPPQSTTLVRPGKVGTGCRGEFKYLYGSLCLGTFAK